MARPKLRIVPLHNTCDPLKGRIPLSSDFSIENVRGLLTEQTFEPFLGKLSRQGLERLLAWDLTIIHEFESDLTLGEEEVTSELLMRFVVAANFTRTSCRSCQRKIICRRSSRGVGRYSPHVPFEDIYGWSGRNVFG